jgi:hypothetical protein
MRALGLRVESAGETIPDDAVVRPDCLAGAVWSVVFLRARGMRFAQDVELVLLNPARLPFRHSRAATLERG